MTDQTDQTKSFVFEIPEKLKEKFNYTSGIFIMFKLKINGKEYKRSYSLSRFPNTEPKMQITMKRIANGVVSNYLNDTLKLDYEILVFPPSGSFFKEPRNALEKYYFFFAGGSSITPIYSIIKTLLYKYNNGYLKLIYVNHDEKSIIFKDMLEKLQQTLSLRFSVIHVLSIASKRCSRMEGKLDQDKMKEILTQLNDCALSQADYYICGPSTFMELVEHELLHQNIPAKNIHLEKFVSIGDSEEAIKVGERKIIVTLNEEKKIVVCQEDQNILVALLVENIDAQYACRGGFCSTCLAKLVSGKVKMKNHASLTDTDISENKVLTCQTVLLSAEAEISYDDVQNK